MEQVLDGFDADVILCGNHSWELEDRTPPGLDKGNPYYLCQVCSNCRAIRCDSGTDTERCVEARHHVLLPHQVYSGMKWPIGMSPGDSTENGRWHL